MIKLLFRASLIGVLSVTALACTTTTTTTVAEPVQAEPGVVQAPAPAAMFPECRAGPFAFIGETSLDAIGLADLASPAEASLVGEIRVTAGPVPLEGRRLGAAQAMSDGRMLCIRFPDGGGMSTTIDDAWQPPGAAVAEPTAPAWPLIGALTVLVVLLGASFLAFRRAS